MSYSGSSRPKSASAGGREGRQTVLVLRPLGVAAKRGTPKGRSEHLSAGATTLVTRIAAGACRLHFANGYYPGQIRWLVLISLRSCVDSAGSIRQAPRIRFRRDFPIREFGSRHDSIRSEASIRSKSPLQRLTAL